MLSNIGLCLRAAACYYFLVLAVNSDRFQILRSYTLLLKPPVLMCSCLRKWEYSVHTINCMIFPCGKFLRIWKWVYINLLQTNNLTKTILPLLCKWCLSEDFTHSSQTVFPPGIYRSYWPNSGCHSPPSLLHPPPPPLPPPQPTYPNHLASYTWIRPFSPFPTHPCPSWMQLHVSHPSPLTLMDR